MVHRKGLFIFLVQMHFIRCKQCSETNGTSRIIQQTSDLKIVPKCFHRPLKALWRATCGPRPVVGPIGVGAGKCLGVRRMFARISPNLPEKFCATLAYRFSLTKIMKIFFADFQTSVFVRSSCVFLQKLGAIFLNQATLGWNAGILPGFSTTQKLWGWACTPCTLTSYITGWTTLFE